MAELNLILLGPPGSGKGTQGERLQEDLEYPYYATGDILRAAVQEGSELGRTAKQHMDEGGLVPDEVIIGVIGERVESPEAADGFILDGFPRTIGQAEALGEEMEKLGRRITAVVLIDTDDAEVQRRLGGRRTCAKNGHIFHVEFDLPNRGMYQPTAAFALLYLKTKAVLGADLLRNGLIDGLVYAGKHSRLHQVGSDLERLLLELLGQFPNDNRRLDGDDGGKGWSSSEGPRSGVESFCGDAAEPTMRLGDGLAAK